MLLNSALRLVQGLHHESEVAIVFFVMPGFIPGIQGC